MRVAASHAWRQQIESIQRASRDSLEAQRIASSGRRIERPSDDPAGFHRATLLEAMQADLGAGRRKAELALREKRRSVGQQVQEAVSAYQAAKAVLESLEREVKATQETAQLLQEEVRQGIAPQSEHLIAQDALLAATVSLARQGIQERLTALALWTSLGEFPLATHTREKPR